MEQGKKESQLKDAETFAFIALMVILAIFIIIGLTSCNNTKAQSDGGVDKTYINIDGEDVELVADEYDNQYLKEVVPGIGYFYIPFAGSVEEREDTLYYYNTKR